MGFSSPTFQQQIVNNFTSKNLEIQKTHLTFVKQLNPHTMKDIFKNFNQDFWKSEKSITWYDKQGVMKLDDQRVVTITIDDIGTRDNYNGYHVEILNKFEGTIVKKWFRFIDHLTMVHRDPKTEYSHVWLYRGEFDWYISRPKDTKEFVKVVQDWINQFK